MSISTLKSYFAETFNMLDDFIRNADVLLKHGFIEAENRLDSYSDDVDNIKITGYGLYMFHELAFIFTYLDIVCTDTGVFKENVSNYLVEAAKNEYSLFTRNERTDRVRTRLERVEQFINYLTEEERREKDLYSLGMAEDDMFTFRCRKTFESESARVIASAIRQEEVKGSGSQRGRRSGARRLPKA